MIIHDKSILDSDWHSVFCFWIQAGFYIGVGLFLKAGNKFFYSAVSSKPLQYTPTTFPISPVATFSLEAGQEIKTRNTSFCKSNDWIIIKPINRNITLRTSYISCVEMVLN